MFAAPTHTLLLAQAATKYLAKFSERERLTAGLTLEAVDDAGGRIAVTPLFTFERTGLRMAPTSRPRRRFSSSAASAFLINRAAVALDRKNKRQVACDGQR